MTREYCCARTDKRIGRGRKNERRGTCGRAGKAANFGDGSRPASNCSIRAPGVSRTRGADKLPRVLIYAKCDFKTQVGVKGFASAVGDKRCVFARRAPLSLELSDLVGGVDLVDALDTVEIASVDGIEAQRA